MIPSLRGWHQQYADQGLVVIGNHYPEFNFERDINAVRESLVRLNVPYPVLQDNGRETWNAYNNRFWPALYLIDRQGRIRYRHFGEGR
ncbi:MAG: redoxin domain-containing protein, partial [Anaerolineaceae bacterium]|nr:redoxin domain-containing protein [Anaerolineaceae bacterium]